jgi:uncharacterized membrane protein YccC
MTDAINRGALAANRVAVASRQSALVDALRSAGEPLLFGVRLWGSVCLALLVAFALELDNPFWAGTSAAVVCQPQLGASLRKGWFRMIGTVVGATMVVVLTACFPQDHVTFLGLLALWGGVCVFAATLLRNFASYAASLAGYTAAIIAADNLGATGGASPDVFMLAIWRASEICIGIMCAGVVLAGTDLGGAPRRLAASLADLAAEIADGFARMGGAAGPNRLDTQAQRRELVRRVIALDPMIDQTLGESSHVRYHVSTLRAAVHGLFRALDGWRGVATHLSRSSDDTHHQAETVLRSIPPELRPGRERGAPAPWIADPIGLCRICERAVRRLLALPAATPSLRLLVDETAKALLGTARVLDGLALLVDAPGGLHPPHGGFRLGVADWLPAVVDAGRAFVAIGAVELFWIATAWPNGVFAIVVVAILVLLLSPKGDLAYAGAIAVTVGAIGSILCAAIIKFAVLPGLETFPAFCLAIGVYYVPMGIGVARSRQPAALAVLTVMASTFSPLLAPTNEMSYDTAQFYNASLAVVAGCVAAALSLALLPPLSPSVRARRLLALTLRDLRRLAIAPRSPSSNRWEGQMYARLAAMPDQAEPLQRARLLAALSVGIEFIQLRSAASRLGVVEELDAALRSFAAGGGATAVSRLRDIDRRLTSDSNASLGEPVTVRARARLLIVSEALVEHASYFDSGAYA